MKKIHHPNGLPPAIHMGTDEQADKVQRTINARHKFNLQYMAEKNWGDDVNALTIDQIMEIRAQDGWKKS